MRKFKTVVRYLILVILILLAICGIPIATSFPIRKEMDEDPVVKTELVEGMEEPE